MPVNTSFTAKDKYLKQPDADNPGEFRYLRVLQYPGGEIHLEGTYEEIYERFKDKGFKTEIIEKILLNLGTVAPEAAIPVEKIVNCQLELVGTEVREQDGSKVKLRVDRLPGKVTRKTLFSAGANNKVRIGNTGSV